MRLFTIIRNIITTGNRYGCTHPSDKRVSTRGYHTQCAPSLGGCGEHFGREA